MIPSEVWVELEKLIERWSDDAEEVDHETGKRYSFTTPSALHFLVEAVYELGQASVPEESKLVALLREALEVLPGRGNLRRRIIQTLDHGSDMNKGS